jgi:hypothetical protein
MTTRFLGSRDPTRRLLRTTSVATLLLLAVALPPAAPAQAPGPLNVVAIPAAQSFTEGGTSSITFRATNKTGFNLVLDYALAIINGPPGFDDNVFFFPNVIFPNVILNGASGDFMYGLDNTNGDPTDVPDTPGDGLNHVSFYLGMSRWNGVGLPGIINPNIPNFGVFLVNAGGVGSTGTLNPATLAKLNACTVAPGPFPNPCPLTAADLLYTGEVQGQPFPTVATVIVNDLPEPATFGSVLLGLVAGVATTLRRRAREPRA